MECLICHGHKSVTALLLNPTPRYHKVMVLTAEYVLRELEKHADELRAFGVKRIGIFGSVARGEAREDSDLDLLVDLEQHTLDAYFDTKFFLEDLFGCNVDLVERGALKARFEPAVLVELKHAQGL